MVFGSACIIITYCFLIRQFLRVDSTPRNGPKMKFTVKLFRKSLLYILQLRTVQREIFWIGRYYVGSEHDLNFLSKSSNEVVLLKIK